MNFTCSFLYFLTWLLAHVARDSHSHCTSMDSAAWGLNPLPKDRGPNCTAPPPSPVLRTVPGTGCVPSTFC